MNRRIVCARCAKIKQACDGGTPCARCKRLGISCERNLGADGSEPSNAITKPVKLTRTHTGCITCKKRKRKCDEARPQCSDCRRLCLDCVYANPRPRQHSSPAASPSTQSLDDLVFASTARQGSRLDNGYEQDISDITSAESLIWTDDDLAEGRSGAMSETPQVPIALLSSHSGSTPSSYDSLPLVMLSTVPDMHSKQDKSLLNHYMKVVAGVLSKRENRDSNPYLTKILPMALSSQLIMDAVLALSASHWKQLQPTVWERGTKHKTNALQSLAKLLPYLQMDSANIALTATLMLCMIELLDGTSSHWKYHLDGARQLLFSIDRQREWRECGDLITFYRELYHYLDSATTISTCHPPLLETPKDTDLPSSEGSPRHGTYDEEALYGVSKELFRFIDKVNGLAYQRKYRSDPVFENMFRASADTLEKELEHWRQNYFDMINASQAEIQSTSDEEAQNATIAYEQAIQLRLHQVINGYSLQHPKVQDCVSKILNAVQEIRYGSPFENCLVFPLTMAGSSCQSESERLIIGDRFLVMERTVGFGYIYTAYDLVQRVWKQRDLYKGTGKDVNWAEIRYYQIPGLALI